MKYRLFVLAAAVLPRTPLWLAQAAGRLVAYCACLGARQTRRRVAGNLRHIPTLAANPRKLQQATRGVFVSATLNYIDFFRGARQTEAQVRAGWDFIDCEQQVLDELQQGKGIVLFASHFGNFERAASRLGVLGYNVFTPVERLKPELLFLLFQRLRSHHRVRVLPADARETLRVMRQALAHNEIVMIANDRYVVGTSEEIPLFGQPARLPVAAARLATRTGVPAYAALSWREPGHRVQARFVPLDDASRARCGELADPPPGAPGGALAALAAIEPEPSRKLLLRFAAALEQAVSAHPEQWVATMSPIWDA